MTKEREQLKMFNNPKQYLFADSSYSPSGIKAWSPNGNESSYSSSEITDLITESTELTPLTHENAPIPPNDSPKGVILEFDTSDRSETTVSITEEGKRAVNAKDKLSLHDDLWVTIEIHLDPIAQDRPQHIYSIRSEFLGISAISASLGSAWELFQTDLLHAHQTLELAYIDTNGNLGEKNLNMRNALRRLLLTAIVKDNPET